MMVISLSKYFVFIDTKHFSIMNLNPFTHSTIDKIPFIIDLEIQVNYLCKKGVSNNWSREHANPRGHEIDQVITEYSRVSKDECRMRCENDNADAYNWQAVQSHGCRCYGTPAVEKIDIQTSRNNRFHGAAIMLFQMEVVTFIIRSPTNLLITS